MDSRPKIRVCARSLLVAAAMLAAAASGPVWAGTITLAWDAVSDADLAGYHVYYGPTAGSHANRSDVAKTSTTTTLSGLADCSMWYVAVRAYDTGGLESTQDSNSVKGWPRPVISTVSPTQIKQGQTLTFTVAGTNFDPGVSGDANHPPATVVLSHPGLTVKSVSVSACGQLTVSVQASSSATPGWSSLTVKNPDLSWSTPGSHPWVFGTKDSAIQIVAAENDTTPPTVSSTNPADGATNVAATVQPTVTFSEPVAAASVSTATVRLLDSSGSPVAQASGSPSTSGAVVTIRPAAQLAAGARFRVEVIGGTAGVKDLAGNALASTYRHGTGFTIANPQDSPGPQAKVVSSSPAPGQTNVSLDTVAARVTFDRDMSSLATVLSRSELQKSFRVLLAGLLVVKQTADSPVFENGGKTVVIKMLYPVRAGASYATYVNLTGSKLKKKLTNAGHEDLAMESTWKSSPLWQTAKALTSASFEGSGDSGALEPSDGSNVPPQNAGVPSDSEFRLTFTKPVSPPSANERMFKIKGDKKIRLAEAPRLENGGRTVVLRPAVPLDAGQTYLIQVKTGKKGVLLVTASGDTMVEAPKPLKIPFATEVSAEELGESLSVGE